MRTLIFFLLLFVLASVACTLTDPPPRLTPSPIPSPIVLLATTQPPATQSTGVFPTVTFPTCQVTANALTLRAEPSYDSIALLHLPHGTVIEVVDDRSTWWQVIAPGGRLGWINSKYCERR